MALLNKPYVSSIDYLDQREIMSKALDVTDEERTILDILELTGKKKLTAVPEYHHFVNQYIFQSGTIDTGGIDPLTASEDGTRVTTVNRDLTIQVQSAEQLPVVTENIMLPTGAIGWVKSVDVANLRFTAQPLDQVAGSELNDGTLADGDKLVYFSTASGEGTSAPEGRNPRWVRSANNIQIFKTASPKVTDLQKVSKIEVEYKGSPHVMYKVQHETMLKHRAEIAFGLLSGKKAKFTDPDGNDVYMTQGLLNYIESGDGSVNTTGGINLDLLGSAITKADFRSMSRQLDKKGAPKEYWLWAGGDLSADIEEMFHEDTNIANGGISYNSWGIGNGKNRAIDMGVDSFRAYKRTWHMKNVEAFDHPEVFGATGFEFGGKGFAIPTGKIKTDKGGEAQDRIQVRYMSGDGTDLMHRETAVGGLLDRPTSDEATIKISYETVAGLEVLGVDHFALIKQ